MARLGGKNTTNTDAKFLYGTPQEVAGRLNNETTESHFSQIRPSTRGGRAGITGRTGKVVKNGKMGGDLRHSGD